MTLKFYKDFNTIGDLELLKGIPILCNIDAVEDTFLIAILSTILRKKHFDNVKLLHHLVDSLSYLVEHLTDKNYIILNSSYLDIAQFLGTTYRHLNRTLKEMESKSIIKCGDKKIYILDINKLRELSKNIYVKSL